MAGGPFVTIAGGKDTISREPRVRIPETDALETNARLERRRDIKSAHGDAFGPAQSKEKRVKQCQKSARLRFLKRQLSPRSPTWRICMARRWC